jgi:hypothetical protein
MPAGPAASIAGRAPPWRIGTPALGKAFIGHSNQPIGPVGVIQRASGKGEQTMAFTLRGISLMATAGLAAVLASSVPAAAQVPLVESPRSKEILARYNEATQAAIMCENRQLGVPGETRIAEMAARASGSQYLTGSMLATVQDSRGWMRMVIGSMGCKDPVVMDRLAFFDQQIAPSLR